MEIYIVRIVRMMKHDFGCEVLNWKNGCFNFYKESLQRELLLYDLYFDLYYVTAT
jgi:hypothetical protein